MSYFPPDLPEFNHLRHLQIITWDAANPIPEQDLMCHVAHVGAKGQPDGWFFDSFLAIPPRAKSGNYLYADINRGTTRNGAGDFFAIPAPNPATAADWASCIDSYFGSGGLLERLDRTAAAARRALGAPPRPRNVVLSIPYPHPNQLYFGRVKPKGASLNFGITGQNLTAASDQRLEACRWFVDECLARWRKSSFRNLQFLGFYWIYESIHYSWDVDDHWVIKELYRHIRARRQKLFWIPFFSTFNAHLLSDYRGFYFDCAFLQPNHMFYYDIGGVKEAARMAEARGAGVEMEYYLDLPPAFSVGDEKHDRFRNYLNGGVEHGYMTQSACAYFLGSNDLQKMARGRDRRERAFYDDLWHFIRGDYEVK